MIEDRFKRAAHDFRESGAPDLSCLTASKYAEGVNQWNRLLESLIAEAPDDMTIQAFLEKWGDKRWRDLAGWEQEAIAIWLRAMRET